jgi:hypothetical protein
VCVTASYCAGKSADENAAACIMLDRAVSGMFRSHCNTFKKNFNSLVVCKEKTNLKIEV